MKVKKYIGDNMQDTIFKVKADLGSDAIILNTRKFKAGGFFGFFGRKKVEVLAGLEDKKKSDESHETLQEINNLKQMINNLHTEGKKMGFSGPAGKVYEFLRKQGVKKSLCSHLLQGLDFEENEDIFELTRRAIERFIGTGDPIRFQGGRKVIMLVGPTGVGKTTTIAKLAACFALEREQDVGLVTADTYRIAAVQQLQTYSDIIDIPIEVVYDPEELQQILNGRFSGCDLVFIDTAGSSWNDQIQLGRLKSFRDIEDIDQVHLLLGLNTRTEDIEVIADKFSQLRPDRVLLSKIDETCSYGNILNIKDELELSFSYYTNGQKVPDDIEIARKEKLADYLLGDFDE
ncbi:MAG: flagellar biosynthesis protein FlhF [Bacillota bacterium]